MQSVWAVACDTDKLSEINKRPRHSARGARFPTFTFKRSEAA